MVLIIIIIIIIVTIMINFYYIIISNITGYSLAFGMCSALDTLISQAYGAKRYELMGLQAQRAAVILTLFSIPIG
jgi:Na+-driven multidrug efflux pump